ncbi:MAG TPA: putative Ig domain-containing protein, partial [Agitococcus sp.]|nr:putative Ig domain-containing protein [Agitococcus sp.]
MALENQGAKEGQAFNYQLPVDAFVDIDGDLLNYIVSLSDGSPLPDWLTFDYVTQTLSGTPTDNDAGALLIKVMANDGMLSAEQEFTISIEDTPYPWWDDWNNISLANVQVLEGEAAQWQLPVLENPDNVVLNYIATLSDGSALPEWLTFDANTLTFSGTPSFDDAG